MSNRWRMRWRRTPLRTLTVIYFKCWLLLLFCRSPNSRQWHCHPTPRPMCMPRLMAGWEEQRIAQNYIKRVSPLLENAVTTMWRRGQQRRRRRRIQRQGGHKQAATISSRMRWERRLTRILDVLSSVTGSSSQNCSAFIYPTERFRIFLHFDHSSGW